MLHCEAELGVYCSGALTDLRVSLILTASSSVSPGWVESEETVSAIPKVTPEAMTSQPEAPGCWADFWSG